MYLLLLQVTADGFRIEPSVLVAILSAIGTSLTVAIAALWRQSVAEGKRKDQLIDRLLDQVGRTTNVQDRTVSLVEDDRRTRR